MILSLDKLHRLSQDYVALMLLVIVGGEVRVGGVNA